MKINDLVPFPDGKITFRLSSFKSIPKEAGCYVLTSFEDDILYIGLTDNLFARFQQHLANSLKTLTTVKGKVIWFYFMPYNRNNLPKLERTWLNQYESQVGSLPILNKVNSPIN